MSLNNPSLLEHILADLKQVGDLLSAIDHAQGDDMALWQEISVINHRIRRLVNQMDEDTLIRLPGLAAFTLSDAQVFSCWSTCADQIEALLSPDAS